MELRSAKSYSGRRRGEGRAGRGAGESRRTRLVRHALLYQLGQSARRVNSGSFMFACILENIPGVLYF